MPITLFDQDGHRCLMFTDLCDNGGDAVQANQFLIVDGDTGAIIDPGGNLAYGELYEAIPFDNRFAVVRLTARDVREMYEENLSEDNGLLLISGLRVRARCEAGRVAVRLEDGRGRAIPDRRALTMVTNDFLATGDRHAFGRLRAEGAIVIQPGHPCAIASPGCWSDAAGSSTDATVRCSTPGTCAWTTRVAGP